MNYKKSIVGSAVAFILATSCCWLPAFLMMLGGGSALMAFSNGVDRFSGLFMAIGIGFLSIGIYQYNKRKDHKTSNKPILKSTITCPECGYKKEEEMPTNACQYFYECDSCQKILKPQEGDCCVYCSFGSVPCPPIQLNQECC